MVNVNGPTAVAGEADIVSTVSNFITLSQENYNPNIFYSVVRTYIPDGIILDCECGGFEVKAPFELQNMQGKIHHLLHSSPVFKSEMEYVAVLSK